MVLILFNSYKWIISYDRAKLKKVGDFYALTWLIFAGLVTLMLSAGIDGKIRFVFTMSPLMTKVATESDFIQCDNTTYDECKQYPYILMLLHLILQ